MKHIGITKRRIVSAIIIVIMSSILGTAAYAASTATVADILKKMPTMTKDTSASAEANGAAYAIKNKVGQYRFNYCGKTTRYKNSQKMDDGRYVDITRSGQSGLKHRHSDDSIVKAILVWEVMQQQASKNINTLDSSAKNGIKNITDKEVTLRAGGNSKSYTADWWSVDNRPVEAANSSYRTTYYELKDGTHATGEYTGSEDNITFIKEVDVKLPVRTTYTTEVMYTDVTDFVKNNGYTTYECNPPVAKNINTEEGEIISSWQLIVLEECPDTKVSAASLKIGAQFNYEWTEDSNVFENFRGEWNNSYTWTQHKTAVDIAFSSDLQAPTYTNSDSEISGQWLSLVVTSLKAVDYTAQANEGYLGIKEKTSGKYIYTTGKAWKKHGLAINSNYVAETLQEVPAGILGEIRDITINDKDNPVWGKNKFTVETASHLKKNNNAEWTTNIATGLIMQSKDYLTDNTISLNGENGIVRFKGKVTVKSDQKNVGYYDGKLVLTLDKKLKKPSKVNIYVTNGGTAEVKYSYSGTNKEGFVWDASKHTLTFSGYKSSKNGQYIRYDVTASTVDNMDSRTIKCSHQTFGKLLLGGKETGISKKHPKKSASEELDVPVGQEGYMWLYIYNPGSDTPTSKIKIRCKLWGASKWWLTQPDGSFDKSITCGWFLQDKDAAGYSQAMKDALANPNSWANQACSFEKRVTVWIDYTDSVNAHDVKLVDSSGNEVDSLIVKRKNTATTAECDGDVRSSMRYTDTDGTTVYRSTYCDVIDGIKISYKKPAYTYAEKEVEKKSKAPLNFNEYSWKDRDKEKHGDDTLNNKGVMKTESRETVSINTHYQNFTLHPVKHSSEVTGKLAIKLKYYRLAITYHRNRSSSDTEKTEKSYYSYKSANSTVNLRNVDNIPFTYENHAPVTGEEWQTTQTGGTKYDQEVKYKIRTTWPITNGTKKRQKEIDLYVNWKEAPTDNVYVQFNIVDEGTVMDFKNVYSSSTFTKKGCNNNSHYKKDNDTMDAWRGKYGSSGKVQKIKHELYRNSSGESKHDNGKTGSEKVTWTNCVLITGSEVYEKKVTASATSLNLVNVATNFEARTGYHLENSWKVGSKKSSTYVSADTIDGNKLIKARNAIFGAAKKSGDRWVTQLYACWEPNQYSIAFNVNGGTLPSTGYNSQTVYYMDDEYNDASDNIPTRQCYTFMGWNTKADGTGETVFNTAGAYVAGSIFNSSGEYAYAGNVTVYAVWKPYKYTINFSKGDTDTTGSPSAWQLGCEWDKDVVMPTQNTMYGRSYNQQFDTNTQNANLDGYDNGRADNSIASTSSRVTGPAPNIGYLPMIGWQIQYATEEAYHIGEIYTAGQALTKPNFTTMNMGVVNAEAQWQDLTLNNYGTPVLPGYQFSGWFDEAIGGNQITSRFVEPDTTGFVDTLYAHWTPNRYTVTYHGNGNWNTEQGDYKQELIFDSRQTLLANKFSRLGGQDGNWCTQYYLKKGYEFQGWSIDNRKRGAEYTDQQTAIFNMTEVNNGNVDLYAIWKKPVKLTLDLNGGAFNSSIANIELTYDLYNEEYEHAFNIERYYGTVIPNGLNSVLTRQEGNVAYRFLGWSLDKDAEAPSEDLCAYNNNHNKVYYIHDDITLYAIWEPVLMLYGSISRQLDADDSIDYADMVTTPAEKEIKALTSDNIKYLMTVYGRVKKINIDIDDKLTEVYRLARETKGDYEKFDDELNDDYLDGANSLSKETELTDSELTHYVNSEFYIPQYTTEYQKQYYGAIQNTEFQVKMKVTGKSHYWEYHNNTEEKAEIGAKIIITDKADTKPGRPGGSEDDNKNEHGKIKYSLDYGNN